MIKELKKTIVCEFGSGDINVAFGVESDCVKPNVSFTNSYKKEIGEFNNSSVKEDEIGLPRQVGEHIRFVFNKLESIDVIIANLQNARELFFIEEKKRLAVVVNNYNKNIK